MAQLLFGVASFLSPYFYMYLVKNLEAEGTQKSWIFSLLSTWTESSFSWVSLYWVFSFISLLMVLAIFFISFPAIERKEDEKMGEKAVFIDLLKSPLIWIYTIAMFCYVGIEQGIANWISEFLRTYHDLNPAIEGAATVSKFWGFMTIGCALGLLLLNLMGKCQYGTLGFSSFRILLISHVFYHYFTGFK
jgi:fucose permease